MTGRNRDRIAQSKHPHAGSLAIVDKPQVARTCILRAFGLQIDIILSLSGVTFVCFVVSFSFVCFSLKPSRGPWINCSSICMRPDSHNKQLLKPLEYTECGRCYAFFGRMVASRGGYRMARGRHYAKLSLSNAPRLSFSDLCILLFLFLSLCRFLCVCVFLLLSLELGRCSSDLFLSSRPRTGLATTCISGYG